MSDRAAPKIIIRLVKPGSAATLNVLTGVMASHTAAGLVLGVASDSWAALTFLVSALMAIIAAFCLARAAAVLTIADQLILERSWAAGYQGPILSEIAGEIHANAVGAVLKKIVFGFGSAVGSVIALMEATVLSGRL